MVNSVRRDAVMVGLVNTAALYEVPQLLDELLIRSL